MPNRWYVEMPCTQGQEPMKIYSNTIEEVQKLFPESTSITPCSDRSHLPYIKKMIEQSEFLGKSINKDNTEQRELYLYRASGANLYIKFSKNLLDDEYYDLAITQERDNGRHIIPVTWDLSTPKAIYKRYFEQVPDKQWGYVVTPREVKKNKYKKWYSKKGEYGWIDSDGYFYFADKCHISNKYDKAEYEQFKDNLDAVYVKYKCASASNYYPSFELKWFDSYLSYLDFKKEMTQNCPVFCETPYFEIIRVGYTIPHPDDRKVVLRMPYLNIERELRYKPVGEVVNMWMRLCEKVDRNDVFGITQTNWFEQVVKSYKEYLAKQKEKEEAKDV